MYITVPSLLLIMIKARADDGKRTHNPKVGLVTRFFRMPWHLPQQFIIM